MAASTYVRHSINRWLSPFNLRIETLTAEKREHARIKRLLEKGHFDHPAYPLSPKIIGFDPRPIQAAYATYQTDLAKLMAGGALPGKYTPQNGFFTSPDAEILYLNGSALGAGADR